MPPTVRLFGTEKGREQWKDGYSAKEQAKAWIRTGEPAVPGGMVGSRLRGRGPH